MTPPARGEIWRVDLDPTRGHEQAGSRPALILSVDPFNRSPAGLVVVLPLTSREKGIRSHVRISPPEGGVELPSFIKCEEPRTIAAERLGRRYGTVSPDTLQAVEDRVRWLLGL